MGEDEVTVTDCRLAKMSQIPSECLSHVAGIFMSDSHARVLSTGAARHWADGGPRVVWGGDGGCNPATFMMVRSKGQSQPPRCERVGPLFDRFVAAPSSEVRFAVVTARWNGYGHRADAPPQKAPKEGLRRLLEFMQRKRLRILLVGPVPEFNYDGVTCILLAERYGIDHAECDVRAVVERRRARQVAMLREVAGEFPGVRYIDPIDLFCDQATCHPGRGRAIYFADSHHLSPAGADLVFQGFARDFAWASEGDAEQTANARDARSQSAPRRFP